jgi:4-hydroxy-3-methylbut-2-enyl diphosphate reductase
MVDPAWLADHDMVGVTAGASAPDQRVHAVIDVVAPTDGIELVRMTEEAEYFPLPPAMRRLAATLQALVEGGYACRTPGRPGLIEQDRDWGATEALELLEV